MTDTGRGSKRGVALLLVMTTILLVALIANIVLNMVSSQTRLTRHKIGNIQAYYASMAGINLAYENLRTGAAGWPMPAVAGNYTQMICVNAALPGCAAAIIDAALPSSIRSITIYIRQSGAPSLMPAIPVPQCNPPVGAAIDACIHAVSDYTYN